VDLAEIPENLGAAHRNDIMVVSTDAVVVALAPAARALRHSALETDRLDVAALQSAGGAFP